MDLAHLALLVLLLAFATLYFLKKRGSHDFDELDAPTNTKKHRRKSDGKALRQPDRAAILQAQRLVRESNPHAAAKVLEDIGMIREAISVLENAGCVHDAAGILWRMGLPNRAGDMCARHKLWAEAIDYYKRAKLPDLVSHCGIQLYHQRKAQFPHTAKAMTMSDIGDHLGSARAFASAKESGKAYEQYISWAKTGGRSGGGTLSESDFAIILENMSAKGVNRELADIIVAHGQRIRLVSELLRVGKIREASILFDPVKYDSVEELIQATDFRVSGAGRELAQFLIDIGMHEYAGSIFENFGDFDRAAHSYEVAKNYIDAARTYELAGQVKHAARMRILLQQANGSMDDGTDDFLGPEKVDVTAEALLGKDVSRQAVPTAKKKSGASVQGHKQRTSDGNPIPYQYRSTRRDRDAIGEALTSDRVVDQGRRDEGHIPDRYKRDTRDGHVAAGASSRGRADEYPSSVPSRPSESASSFPASIPALPVIQAKSGDLPAPPSADAVASQRVADPRESEAPRSAQVSRDRGREGNGASASRASRDGGRGSVPMRTPAQEAPKPKPEVVFSLDEAVTTIEVPSVSNMAEMSYPKGSFLPPIPSNQSNHAYFLVQGTVHEIAENELGELRIMSQVEAGLIFGFAREIPGHKIHYQAMTDCVIRVVKMMAKSAADF